MTDAAPTPLRPIATDDVPFRLSGRGSRVKPPLIGTLPRSGPEPEAGAGCALRFGGEPLGGSQR